MNTVATRAEVSAAVGVARSEGRIIGFVPTMGYLHDGHLSLVDRARSRSDFIVMSVFVNPLQFGPSEDLSRYPRDLERDTQLAQERGVDVLFVPTVQEMYPDGDAVVRIQAGAMGDVLCGAFRPGHFSGVLTVVAKLFNIVTPNVAVFGQKDYQQAAVIRRMVVDLDMPVQIEVAPIERDADGLALSSRNVFLRPAERVQAVALNVGLHAAKAAFDAGERDAAKLRQMLRTELDPHPLVKLQYGELVDATTLQPVDKASAGNVLAIAAYVGATRLIDNVIL